MRRVCICPNRLDELSALWMAVDSAKKYLNRSVGILVTGMSAAEMETKLGRFGLPLTFIAESASIIYPPSNSLFCAEDAFVLLFAFCVR